MNFPEFFADMKMSELPMDMPPALAAIIFESPYDPAIKSLLGTMKGLGFTDDEWLALLVESKKLLESVNLHIPRDLTVGESGPYVAVSDLTTLGMLTHIYHRDTERFMDEAGRRDGEEG